MPSWGGFFGPGIQSMNGLVGERVTTSVALASETENRRRVSLVGVERRTGGAVCRTNVSRDRRPSNGVREKKRRDRE